MGTYAATTEVSSDNTQAEIKRTLLRYGATKFLYGEDESTALIGFVMHERHVKFLLPLPDRDGHEFTHTPVRKTRRTVDATEQAYEQAVRQRWRALNLVIKAKLEAVESGIVGFVEEFGPFMVLPDGSRMIDHMEDAIDVSYETGEVPPLLPGLPGLRGRSAIPIAPPRNT